MPTFTMDFQNNTDRTWTMALYQTLPMSAGLESVSWQQTTAPVGGRTGVRWDTTYNVVLANYIQSGSVAVYKPFQILAANLGTAWDIVFDQNVQQLRPAGQAGLPQQITIRNASGRSANPGVGMSGSAAVYRNSLMDRASVPFDVTPTYFVGLFNSLQKGQVITSNVIVGPLKVQYPPGSTSGTLTARLDGNTIKLSIDYR